jgi:hypothetical protein
MLGGMPPEGGEPPPRSTPTLEWWGGTPRTVRVDQELVLLFPAGCWATVSGAAVVPDGRIEQALLAGLKAHLRTLADVDGAFRGSVYDTLMEGIANRALAVWAVKM